MARKPKKSRQAEETSIAPDEVSTDAGEIETPEPEAAPPPAEVLDLHDAARRWVPGYQERWWDGIRKHATAMGFGEGGTEEQCKSVLRHWGAKC